jgi:hypothetical protein
LTEDVISSAAEATDLTLVEASSDAHKWRLAGERGYMSVLVDVEKVHALVRGRDHGGFTSVALKDRLQTTDRIARALMAQRHLKTVTVFNPVNCYPTVIVPAEEVERFKREYISLFTLAKQQGRHFRAVKQEFDVAGIRPALDPEKVGATFYRRTVVDESPGDGRRPKRHEPPNQRPIDGP